MTENLDVARVKPLPREDWPPEMQDALAAMQAPPRPPPPPTPPGQQARGSNVLGLFANYPKLSKAFFAFNGHILYGSTMAGRERELVICRVAALRQAGYEWAQHVQMGRDEGLTDDEIEAIIVGPDADGWSVADRTLLTAVDELVGSTRISDATWSALSGQNTTEQLMDIVFTVGTYELLAMAFNSFQLQMEDSLKLITPRLEPPTGDKP